MDVLNDNGGCLGEPMAAFYFLQLVEAVTFMHSSGFAHRDIKPEVGKRAAGFETHGHDIRVHVRYAGAPF